MNQHDWFTWEVSDNCHLWDYRIATGFNIISIFSNTLILCLEFQLLIDSQQTRDFLLYIHVSGNKHNPHVEAAEWAVVVWLEATVFFPPSREPGLLFSQSLCLSLLPGLSLCISSSLSHLFLLTLISLEIFPDFTVTVEEARRVFVHFYKVKLSVQSSSCTKAGDLPCVGPN